MEADVETDVETNTETTVDLRTVVWDELRRIEGALSAAVREALAEAKGTLEQPSEIVVLHLEEGPTATPPQPWPAVGDFQIVPGRTQVTSFTPPYGGATVTKEERTAPKLIFKRPSSIADAVERGVDRALALDRTVLHELAEAQHQVDLLHKDRKEAREEVAALHKRQQALELDLQKERNTAAVLTDAIKQLRHEDEAFKKLEQQVRVLRMEVGERRARELLGEEG